MGPRSQPFTMDPMKPAEDVFLSQLRAALNNCLYCSPAYGLLKRQLGEYMIRSGKSLEGVMHLVESLAGKHKFDHLKMEQEWKLSEKDGNESVQNIDVVKVFTSIPCEYTSPEQFLSDLNGLPEQWTLVQITRQALVGNILQIVREHTAGANFTLQKARLVLLSPGQCPLQVLLDKPLGSDDRNNATYYDLMSEAFALLCKSAGNKNNREEASTLVKQVSNNMTDCWLREYQCLLPGKLKCPRLALAVTDVVSKLTHVTRSPEAAAFLCRLLSGCHLIQDGQIKALVERYVTEYDAQRTRVVLSCAVEFKNKYSVELLNAARFPVILMLEEELDKLPWETMLSLRCSPVTRVHCFQFVLALFKLHQRSDKNNLQNGYLQVSKLDHEKDTFVILNPSSDLPSVETNFKSFLSQKFGQWMGLTGRVPSATEFSSGLNHSLFIYCGHGNGTLYFSSQKLGRSRIRSVTMLFGCRSVERVHLGGRVPFSSIAEKYIIAGSPCVIGNLWNVSNTDCDRIAANLINLSLPSPPSLPRVLDLHSITSLWWNVSDLRFDSRSGNNARFGDCQPHVRDVNTPDTYAELWAAPVAAKTPTKTRMIAVPQLPGMAKKRGRPCAKAATEDFTGATGDSLVARIERLNAGSCNSDASLTLASADLALNVQRARQGANYFVNGAALVVWGLPVWFPQ